MQDGSFELFLKLFGENELTECEKHGVAPIVKIYGKRMCAACAFELILEEGEMW